MLLCAGARAAQEREWQEARGSLQQDVACFTAELERVSRQRDAECEARDAAEEERAEYKAEAKKAAQEKATLGQVRPHAGGLCLCMSLCVSVCDYVLTGADHRTWPSAMTASLSWRPPARTCATSAAPCCKPEKTRGASLHRPVTMPTPYPTPTHTVC